ncbi:MAG TPA: hypothetical protein VHI13_07540, partial [Candidatus Kapabacteria bacterium]|nr:hypothetical protein [Candidatus Kapabacteria bacterium]
AATTVSGYPFTVTLNYNSSVAFSAFRTYQDGYANLYSHWSRISQNRPAWCIGVNGFCAQLLSSNTSYICDPSRYNNGQDTTRTTFTDRDAVWLADGYDFNNRLGNFSDASDPGTFYTDRIQLLRADGSVLTLLHNAEKSGLVPIEQRSDLYTGVYFTASANSKAFGVVSIDTSGWAPYAQNLLSGVAANERWKFMPRVLKYYPGDGLEYVFTEYVIPYGMQSYAGRGLAVPTRYGGMLAGPTVFYLTAINSNSGVLLWNVQRTRHYYPRGAFTLNQGNIYDPIFYNDDSTCGRALVIDIGDVHIDYGDISMTIQAYGRTTQVRYPKVQPSGSATSTTMLPLATRGYFTRTAEALSHLQPEGIASGPLYESSLGYVTDIIDPEGRKTSFEYEPYKRTYRDFNFPVKNHTGVAVNFTTSNLRLTHVTEPAQSYRISYAGGDWLFNGNWLQEDTVRAATILATGAPGTDSLDYPYLHTNVASVIRKYDHSGAQLLTEQRNMFRYNAVDGFYHGEIRTTDTVTHQRHTVITDYRSHPLPDSLRRIPAPRFTEMTGVTDSSEVITTSRTITQQMAISPYVWLPVSDTSKTDGVVTGIRTYSYQFDTARTYGGDTRLTSLFGPEVKLRVATVIDPGTNAVWLRDSAFYYSIRHIDTDLVRLDTGIDKFATLANYRAALDSGTIRGRWEDWMYNPRIAVFRFDSTTGRTSLPPQYGLLRREVAAEANGTIISGREYVYAGENAGAHYLNGLMWRGTLDSVFAIGAGGVRRLAAATTWSHWGGLNVPLSVTNANGVAHQFYYGTYNAPKLFNGHDFVAKGSVLRNDNTKQDTTLPNNGYFSTAFSKPLVSQSVVRRYDAGDTVRRDTLLAVNTYGFYGLVTSQIDANGNFGANSYDHNGRLMAAWWPLDFPRRDTMDTMRYTSRERVPMIGFTRHHYTVDTVLCDSGGMTHAGAVFSDDLTNLYAGHLPTVVPDCPCPPPSPETKHAGSHPQQSCTVHLPYTANDYHTGYLVYDVDSSSALLNADVLDSLYLELHPTAITGECVNVTVSVPQWSFAKTYVFNCGEDPLGTNGTRRKDGDGKSGGRAPLSGGDGSDGYTLKVDLSAIKSQFLALHPGSQITITLDVATAGGGAEFVNGADAEDARPALVLAGRFKRATETTDYTIAYSYADDSLKATASTKLDDIRHTANLYDLAATSGATIRRAASTSTAGADGRILRTVTPFTGHGAARTDTTASTYSGSGARLRTRDRSGDTAVVQYDGAGRPVKATNADGTSGTVSYQHGLPSAFGLSNADWHGFCAVTTTRNEDGVAFTRYTDGFGHVRCEIADTNGLKLTTRYEYDTAGRMSMVVSPKGDTTRYGYDAWGRVLYRQGPDIGAVSCAYDAAGNLRFSQTAAQAANSLLAFTEYDDLNRPTIIGEAFIANSECGEYDEDQLNWFCGPITGTHRDGGAEPGRAKHAGARMQAWSDPLAARLTNQADGAVLHTGATSSILTANRTLWSSPIRPTPTFSATSTFAITNCVFPPLASLGETDSARGPMIVHPAGVWTSPGVAGASLDDFENIGLYPEFVRTAISYDTIPMQRGAVWAAFPPLAKWNAIAPKGALRNQKGREAAIAWRERGSEPFHYAVLSYDERGRVEALLRYTENLGYDAVYYAYNSANQATSVAVADPLRQYTTWYGTGGDGRVDSVWTALGASGTGLINNGNVNQWRYPAPLARPAAADIVYRYTKAGNVDSMSYPPAGVLVTFAYNHMKRLDSIVATKSGADLFREVLSYDPTGQITQQIYAHSGGARQRQLYSYDSVQRLTQYTQGPASGGFGITSAEGYSYDATGNRLEVTNGFFPFDTYSYTPGTNQLQSHTLTPGVGTQTRTDYYYDESGAIHERDRFEVKDGTVLSTLEQDEYRYDFRNLLKRAYTWHSGTGAVEDWYYRYSPGGERDQKRLYAA